jgi:mevalonate kinase
MKSVTAKAPGKVILFGEHAVVYGFPAIASAISSFSKCIVEEAYTNGFQIELENYDLNFDFQNKEKMYRLLPKKFEHIGHFLDNFERSFDITLKNIKIKFSSVLFPSSGLGSSASTSVALIKALSSFYNINLKKEEISNFAFQMEQFVHGTPSGIDNTICTHGNMILYRNNKFDFIKPKFQFPILVTSTNIEHNTKKAINVIRELKCSYPQEVYAYFNNIKDIVEKAKSAILHGKIKEIGEYMNLNHKILEKLKVSNTKISEIRKIALEHGALGSKITGAGLGGCVISIGEKKDLEKINSLLKNKGFDGFITRINKTGVKIEK